MAGPGAKPSAGMMFITLRLTVVSQPRNISTHTLTHKRQRAKLFPSNNVPPPEPPLCTQALWEIECILLWRAKVFYAADTGFFYTEPIKQ